MKLGLSSYAYRWSIAVNGYVPAQPLDAKHFVLKAIEHGVQGVHLCDHLGFMDQPDEELREIRRLSEDHGMFVETGASSCRPAFLEKMIEISAKLGARVLRAIPEINRACSMGDIESQLARLQENLRQTVETARKAKIRIALENHAQITAAELHSLVSALDSDYVGVCLDTMNSVVLLENPRQTAELLGPVAITAHFKDFKVIADPQGHRIVGVSLGEGMVDFPAILEILAGSGLNPNVNIELFIARKENEEVTQAWEKYCVRKSIQYARDVLGIKSNKE